MKIHQRFLVITMALILLIPMLCTVLCAKAPGVYTITTEVLNVRSDPNTESSVIGKVYKDQQHNVVEVKGSWGRISYNGKVGWISLDYAVPGSTASNKQYSVGSEGLAMIKKLEGYRQFKYWDYNHYSIGYGTTCGAADYPDGITEAEASNLLLQALAKHEVYLDSFLSRYGITVSQKQYDALVSFTYNLGNPWTKYDSFKLKDLLIDGAYKYKPQAVKDAFLQFKKAGGVVVQGLITRRNMESSLFLSGTPALGRPFYDVNSGHWFNQAVTFCYQKGIMSGNSDLKYSFDPYGNLTRAQMVTLLAQMSKVDKNAYKTSSFSDVAVGSWYAPYVQWAYSKGIVSGTGNGKFSPHASITRQDMVVMLYNYTKSLSKNVSASSELVKNFADHGNIAPYAVNAMNWAISVKCINGDNKNMIAPRATANRAQVAQVASSYATIVLGYK